MTTQDILQFMEDNDCTVVRDTEDDRWEIRIHLEDKIIGAKAATLEKAIQSTIDYMTEKGIKQATPLKEKKICFG